MDTSILNSTVAAGTNLHLHTEVEVADRGSFPCEKMVPLEGSVGRASDGSIFHRPVFRFSRPALEIFAVEQLDKTIFFRPMADHGGRLGVWGCCRLESALERSEWATELLYHLVGACSHFLENFRVFRVLC